MTVLQIASAHQRVDEITAAIVRAAAARLIHATRTDLAIPKPVERLIANVIDELPPNDRLQLVELLEKSKDLSMEIALGKIFRTSLAVEEKESRPIGSYSRIQSSAASLYREVGIGTDVQGPVRNLIEIKVGELGAPDRDELIRVLEGSSDFSAEIPLGEAFKTALESKKRAREGQSKWPFAMKSRVDDAYYALMPLRNEFFKIGTRDHLKVIDHWAKTSEKLTSLASSSCGVGLQDFNFLRRQAFHESDVLSDAVSCYLYWVDNDLGNDPYTDLKDLLQIGKRGIEAYRADNKWDASDMALIEANFNQMITLGEKLVGLKQE